MYAHCKAEKKNLKNLLDSCDSPDEMAGEPGAKKTTQPVRWVRAVCVSRCRTDWAVWGLPGGEREWKRLQVLVL